jgi:hypothetical protein
MKGHQYPGTSSNDAHPTENMFRGEAGAIIRYMHRKITRRQALASIGNSLLFAAGGGARGSTDQPTSPLSIAMASMKQRHEAYPHGISSAYSWRNGPTTSMGCYPNSTHLPSWSTKEQKSFLGPWLYTANWFAVCRAADSADNDLNQSTNTGVLIGAMSYWVLSRKAMSWVPIGVLQLPTWCDAFRESGGGSVSRTSPVKATTADGIVCLSPNGYFSHGGQRRSSIHLEWNDIAAMVGTVNHRLERFDPNLPDDSAQARFIVQCGADYYPDATTTATNLGGYAPDAASGQFIYARKHWQTSTFFAKAPDMSEYDVLAVGWPSK